MKYFKYKQKNLFCEKTKILDICKKIETPFYLYSYNSIVNNFKNLQKALKGIKAIIAYSVKANSNLSILKTLAKCGAGADIVSMGELKKVLKAGIPSHKIVYSGVGKSREEISFALEKKIEQFNIESLEELYTLSSIAKKKNTIARIALRINPDIVAGGHPKISTGKKTDKFGITINDAYKIYNLARDLKNIKVVGVDIHIGSQILKTQPFKRAFNKVLSFTNNLEKKGHSIKNIDIGGGIGVNYSDEIGNNEFLIEYTNLIKTIYKNSNKTIILEPGRYLLANCGILVTQVLYRKISENKNFLILDAGMNNLMRPALYDAKHNIKPLKKESQKSNCLDYEVVGPICETADILSKKSNLSKNISQGDYFFIDKVGAYGSVMSSSYNSKDLASEILVKDEKFYEIKKRINTEDLIEFESIAPWLKKN